MPRRLHVGARASWSSIPNLSFTENSPTTANLANFVSNPRNATLTYSVSSGSLPSGCSLSGSIVTWTGSGTIGSTVVRFRVTQDGKSNDSPNATVDILPVADDVLPTANEFDWSAAGVPGGIPIRTTIFQTLNPGATTSQIQTALNNCPAGQVVFLSAGTYNGLGALRINRDNITLRGAVGANGWPTTILNFLSGGWGCIDLSKAGYPSNNWAGNSSRAISTGYNQGSTQITLASAPTGLVAGQLFVIDQLDDESLVRNSTSAEGGGTWGRNGNRVLQQMLRVVSVSGSTVNFEPELYSSYWSSGQSPQVYWFGSGAAQVTTLSGIENLQINAANNGSNVVAMGPADRCWLKNIRSFDCPSGGGHIRTGWTLNCEIRDCSFSRHESVGSATYSVWSTYTSALRCENNIMFDTPCAIGCMSTSGSVFAYNFGTIFPYSQTNWMPETFMTGHGGHNYANLVEGNHGPTSWHDFTHGNASYVTIARNRWTGVESGKTQSTRPINLQAYQHNFAVIGNILGTDGYHNAYTGPDTAIYGIDATSLATLTRKGNFNYFDDAIPAGEALGGQTVSESYQYTAKPAWWGTSLAWPPFSAASPSNNQGTRIPAGYRYANDTWPT